MLPALIYFTFTACVKKEQNIYIEVDGQRISEETLRENRPEVYKSIRREYNQRLQEALERLANDRLFALEAEGRGLKDSQEYIRLLRSAAPEPEEGQIRAYYDRLNQGGAQPPYPEARNNLVQTLKNQQFQSIFQADLSRLRKKYNYNEYAGEIERQVVDIEGEPVRGNPEGKLLVVEFSGYECPFCKRSQSTANSLRSKYKEIKWVFKDYPLRSNRLDAHLAANCVNRLQGVEDFWNFFDDLYSPAHGRDYLEKASLRKAAEKFGIDLQAFDSCIQDNVVKEEILNDHAEGISLGVKGIPAFFINGRLLEGAQPLQSFEKLIEQELQEL